MKYILKSKRDTNITKYVVLRHTEVKHKKADYVKTVYQWRSSQRNDRIQNSWVIFEITKIGNTFVKKYWTRVFYYLAMYAHAPIYICTRSSQKHMIRHSNLLLDPRKDLTNRKWMNMYPK